MKNHVIYVTLLLFIAIQFGYSPKGHADDQKTQKLNSVQSYSNLVELLDDVPLMNKISEMQNSDDPKLDLEDKAEIRSKKDKIILVGDSWATFPCLYNSMGKTINDVNAKIIEDNRCLRTSKLGIEARQWIGSKQDLRVIKFLKNTPRLKYMYLSLGGNDLMASWTKDSTPDEELKLFNDTFNTIQKIIQNYLAIRPDIKIVLSGYDFPHFKENHPIALYRNIFERMGSPTELRLNRALVGFSRFMTSIANGQNILYIHHLGLAQYYDGVPESNYPAKRTLAPALISPMNDPAAFGGDINFKTSEKSMINWLYLTHDAFHLNTRMYRNLMHHTYDNVLVNIIK